MGAEFIFSVIATVSSLLTSLRSSGATSAAGEGDGIERDLDRLERLLKRIQATLSEASEKEIRDASVKLWLQELRAVAFEAEDILDECQYELLCRQMEESGEASSSLVDGEKRKRLDGVISDEMAQKFKNVIERFEEISRDKEALSLREDEGERRGCVWPGLLPTSHMVNESSIFGRDQDKQKILDFVLSDNTGRINPISVVAIVGMGGVGKTTLAQLVYNDSLVQNHFYERAWVYVSPEFDVIRITKEILESINPQESYGSITGLSAAHRALIKVIRAKKLLIVLDDVWNDLPSKWEQFLGPLRVAESVVIIVTTRNNVVAQITGDTDMYDLTCLSGEQSSLLFDYYAFGNQFIDETSCLRKIGVQIVRKCAGLPLAIKSIGRALCYKSDEDSWRGILESELWESDGKNEIFPALKVSYYSLPSELKPCFLFCSLFPKGSVLREEEIIYMWIAHGYIQSCGSRRAEDLGNEFIHELYRRSFLTKNFDSRQRERFTMHDLIHDLGRFISMDECYTINQENMNEVYTGAYHTYKDSYGMIDGLSRRRFLMRTLLTNFVKFPDSHYDLDLMGRYNSMIPMNLNLRVLKWEGAYAHDLINIAKLKHLRYFELNNCILQHLKIGYAKLQRLPESITLLFNLVALRLSFLENLIELPINIGKMLNLRFLYIHQLGIRDLPESFDQLSNLQYLSVSSCKHLEILPTSIGNLTNLKQLYISYLQIRELPESLCMLQKLQTLSLKGCCHLRQLPNGIGNLINLRWIYCESRIETLPESISRLYNLEILELGCRASPVALLCGFEGLLNRSSLNFFIRNGREPLEGNISQNKIGPFMGYVKTKRFMESVEPSCDLVRLEINGYQGIGYAWWFPNKRYHQFAIAMHCHVTSDNFFTELGYLPSVKSLRLVGITSIHNLQFNPSRFSTSHNSKVLFPSLKEIELTDMFEWNSSIVHDGDFPVLESLKIENCPKLSSVPYIGNLRRLEIIRCSFSKIELNFVQLLESLHIEECIQLTLLQGLQSLNFIQMVYIIRCPLLKELLPLRMPIFPLSIEIVECPSLKNWSQCQLSNYREDFSSKKLVTSGIWYTMKKGYRNVFVEHLVIRNCIERSLELDRCLYNLTSLEIRSCWNLGSLSGLEEAVFLRSLVLWDCPILQLKNSSDKGERPNLKLRGYGADGEIPLSSSLQSLAVHGCHRMLSLNLLVEDPSSLTDLKVTDCKRLKYIRDLQKLTNLETLSVIQCPQLLLQPLHNMPDHVVISRCPRLKSWCKWHSVEPLDDEMKLST